MISFNSMGRVGRLGNQMFQYAVLKGIAKNNNLDFCIPASLNQNEHTDHQLFGAFEMKDVKQDITQNLRFDERFYHFDEDLFNNCPDNIDLYGYFQSYRYFDFIRDEILEDFTFKHTDSFVIPEEDYTVIHARRGDYVNQPQNYNPLGKDYYNQAKEIIGDSRFIVISDDIEWCKQQEFFNNCEFYSSQNNIEDLYVMSKAKNNIIANSSFSWWGAYLNKNSNKIVVSPEKWYNNNYSYLDIKDLRPKEWILI